LENLLYIIIPLARTHNETGRIQMNNGPKVLVLLAGLSILVGILVKLIGLDLSAMGIISSTFPIKPLSFLNFSNSVLLFAIAWILLKKTEEK